VSTGFPIRRKRGGGDWPDWLLDAVASRGGPLDASATTAVDRSCDGHATGPGDQSGFTARRIQSAAPGVDPDAIAAKAYDMNLTVNFVHNHNLAIGKYATAISYLTSRQVSRPRVRPLLPRACVRAVRGKPGAGAERREHFARIVETDAWWGSHAARHGLVPASAQSSLAGPMIPPPAEAVAPLPAGL
jgi:hypothetical protein